MCAPTRDLAKIAVIAAAAYATGGSSLFASSTAAATTGAATTSAAGGLGIVGADVAATGFNLSGMFSTLGSYAKFAAPIIGAAGQIYSGVLNANLLKGRANMVDYSTKVDMEASALRKIQRQRQLVQAVGKQRALYGITGVTIEGTPTDILEQTSAKFAESQFIDDFNTASGLYSKSLTAESLRAESNTAVLGGVVNAAATLAGRGLEGYIPPKTKPSLLSQFNPIPMGQGETF
jgi:hypothetical protein